MATSLWILPRIEAWKTAALEHGIATIMQTSPSKTKNATDIALCIDAMDILHAPNSLVDTFVLVTNDGDFAPLAQRLRLMSMESVSGDEHTQKKNKD